MKLKNIAVTSKATICMQTHRYNLNEDRYLPETYTSHVLILHLPAARKAFSQTHGRWRTPQNQTLQASVNKPHHAALLAQGTTARGVSDIHYITRNGTLGLNKL